MIEVEAKVKIDDLAKIKKKAGEIGKYIGYEKKIDEYYTLESLKKYPKKSLRIRERGNFYEVNFKQRISYVKGVHAKKEVEFKISDIECFKKLISEFGFKLWLKKEKESYIYFIKKGLNIELNKVGGLGWFLEIEFLCSKKSEIENARKEILRIIKILEIPKKDLIKEGYTKMLWDSVH